MFEKNSDADEPIQDEGGNEVAGSGETFASQSKAMFDEHKGKLAIGVAATLGAMIFYNWLERQLAKQDPEGHARLQRLKAIVRADDDVGISYDDAPDDDDDEGEGHSSPQRTGSKYTGEISAGG